MCTEYHYLLANCRLPEQDQEHPATTLERYALLDF